VVRLQLLFPSSSSFLPLVCFGWLLLYSALSSSIEFPSFTPFPPSSLPTFPLPAYACPPPCHHIRVESLYLRVVKKEERKRETGRKEEEKKKR
jgi:hypothetical protein